MSPTMTPRPPRRRRGPRLPPGLLAFVVSVGLHVGALVFLVAYAAVSSLLGWDERERPEVPPVQAVGLRPLSADDWAKNRGEKEPERKKPSQIAEAKPKARDEKKKPEPRPEGQVVDVAPGNNEESEDAAYLAESANKVKKETKAKDQTAFYRNAMPKRTTTTPDEAGTATQPEQQTGNNGRANDDRPLRDPEERKLAIEVPDVKARDEVRLDSDPESGAGPQVANRTESAEIRGNSKRLRLQDGTPSQAEDSSEGKAGATAKSHSMNLMPSMSVLDSVNGAAPNDHLDDVAEGDGTYLNTREWKYASFFNRVKQSIGMNWDPSRELRQRDPTGNVYGARDRHTVLQVTLNERGMIKDIFVQKSCGLDFLDLEAVQSFERAQPFPNPPPGLLQDQTVSFSFGFFVDMGGSPRMRMFRSNN